MTPASPAKDTRQIIIDAAFDCFRHYGLRKTTVVEIGRQARLSRGTIYQHFRDKAAIVEACAETGSQRFYREMAKAVDEGSTLEDKLSLAAVFVARVRRYIEPFFGAERGPGFPRDARVGCVVLGCTHFPLFHQLIERELYELGGRGIPVVDSAQQTAREVREFLASRGLQKSSGDPGALKVLVTDMPKSFEEVATRFLGDAVGEVEQLDLKP